MLAECCHINLLIKSLPAGQDIFAAMMPSALYLDVYIFVFLTHLNIQMPYCYQVTEEVNF